MARIRNKINWEQNDDPWSFDTEEPNIGYDEELFATCMRRFLYIRCYDSFEFLATLKVRSSFEITLWIIVIYKKKKI